MIVMLAEQDVLLPVQKRRDTGLLTPAIQLQAQIGIGFTGNADDILDSLIITAGKGGIVNGKTADLYCCLGHE